MPILIHVLCIMVSGSLWYLEPSLPNTFLFGFNSGLFFLGVTACLIFAKRARP